MFSVAIVAAALSACGGEQVPIRLGVVLGGDGMRGARLAADSVNRAGGINGRPLELVVLEGQWLTSAEAAIGAADSLTRYPGILAVIGHANSSASLAASQVYNAARIVQIAPNSSAPLYRGAGPYSYRMVGSDSRQAEFLVDELARRGARRVAVFYVNDDYGRSLHDSVAHHAAVRRISLVLEMPHLSGDTFPDLPVLMGRVARARADAILWLGRGEELRRFLVEARRRLPDVPVIASDGVGSYCCINDGSRRTYAGITYTRMTNPAITPELSALRRRYVTERGGALTDQALLSYDAVLLLAGIITRVGPDRERIRQALEDLTRGEDVFRGVSGPIAFDTAGDARTGYFLDTVRSP